MSSQANTFEGFREGIEYIHQVRPFRPVITMRSIELLDMVLKQNENAAARVAGLSGCVRKSSFVHLRYSFKAKLKIRWKLEDDK